MLMLLHFIYLKYLSGLVSSQGIPYRLKTNNNNEKDAIIQSQQKGDRQKVKQKHRSETRGSLTKGVRTGAY